MNHDKDLTIGERLKIARNTHVPKLSQKDVAKRSGLTQPAISELERGTTHGTPKIMALAAAVNVNIVWLASGEGEMRSSGTEEVQELLRLSHAVRKLGLTREQIEQVVDKAISHASKISFED